MNANDKGRELKDQTRQALEKAGDEFSGRASQLRDVAEEARYYSEDFIQANPWLAVGLAVGAGFLVGVLFARR